jgi:RimJ/RimL family protein N-acetyltransferase
LFDTINAVRDGLLPWLPWARTEHREIASTLNFISSQILRRRKPLAPEGVALGVFDRSTGDLLGGSGFHDLRRDTASVEVGYWVRADRHNQGICTEATAHWLSRLLAPQDAGGLGLRRVRIYCSAQNKASARVPEKLGLRAEVMQRQDYFVPHHGVTDRLGWGVIHDEWDHHNHRSRQ